jgi:hypothetical protein
VNFRRGTKVDGVALASQCVALGEQSDAWMARSIMTEDRKNVLPSLDQTYDRNVRISPSELLSLLDSFHGRLDSFFEEMRTLPETTAQQKAGNSRSLTSEWTSHRS